MTDTQLREYLDVLASAVASIDFPIEGQKPTHRTFLSRVNTLLAQGNHSGIFIQTVHRDFRERVLSAHRQLAQIKP